MSAIQATMRAPDCSLDFYHPARIVAAVLGRDLPERYGPWQTVASQLYRWVHAGIWAQRLAALQRRQYALD